MKLKSRPVNLLYTVVTMHVAALQKYLTGKAISVNCNITNHQSASAIFLFGVPVNMSLIFCLIDLSTICLALKC